MMTKTKALLAAAGILTLSAAGGALARTTPVAAIKAPTLGTGKVLVPAKALGMLRTPELLGKLGTQVTLSGFYYEGSAPMLIDDLARLELDMMLPPDSYVPLTGTRLQGVKNGDKIQVTALLKRPPAGSPSLVREPAVLEITPQVKAVMQKASSGVFRPILATQIVRLQPQFRISAEALAALRAKKYAVLIIGGGSTYDNHLRYWNDLKTMYQILLDRGYAAANITVVYANGVARDGSVPVNYSASKVNLSTVFTNLAAKTTSNDTVYVMVNDHGGGFWRTGGGGYPAGNYSGALDTNGDEAQSFSEIAFNKDLNGDGDKTDVAVKFDQTICLWYDTITDDAFAAELNKVTRYEKMIIQMKQCFSGGFVADLRGPRRIVMASALADEPSWSEITAGQYGEWTYWYFAAITGQKPDGSGAVPIKSKFAELFNYCKSQDRRPETPHYDDNGALPTTNGPLPRDGDGVLGAASGL